MELSSQVIAFIETMTEEQMRAANHLIVEKLKTITATKRASALSRFKTGERVQFRARGNSITGTITRINHKTISVTDDTNGKWRIGDFSSVSKCH